MEFTTVNTSAIKPKMTTVSVMDVPRAMVIPGTRAAETHRPSAVPMRRRIKFIRPIITEVLDLTQCGDKDRAQGDHDESQKYSAGKNMHERSDQACDHKCQVPGNGDDINR